MTIHSLPSQSDLDAAGARFLVDLIKAKPDAHLVLATGGSPTGIYREVAAFVERGEVSCMDIHVTMLDEWYLVPPEFPGSCLSYLQEQVIKPWGVNPDRFLTYPSMNNYARDLCQKFESTLLSLPPIDLCVLGLGENGHIGMNEPDAFLLPGVHVADLLPESINHPMLGDLDPRPTRGLTLGMGNILSSKQVLVVASGQAKQEAIGHLRSGRITTHAPCSFLAMHANVTVLITGIL